jgi:hypothetical protein
MSPAGVPPSTGAGGGVGLVQMPEVWPAGMMQTLPLPGQQSEVAVHLPPLMTHAVLPHTKWPVASGMQTVPLQQSAEVAQAMPAATHALTVKQRGTPTASTRQVILFAPGLVQQSALTPETEQPLGIGLHVSPIGQLSQQMPFESMSWQWQTSPSGIHVPPPVATLQLPPFGGEQTPSPRAVSKIVHFTSPSPGSGHMFPVLPPQQSESWWQRSPWIRQPPAG